MLLWTAFESIHWGGVRAHALAVAGDAILLARPIRSKLSHINEAANALVILPNATDFSMDHMATFPTLNLAQMKHIIDSYTPCEYVY